MNVTIRTNNVPRAVIDAYQLTEKERKEFDYLNWQKIDAGEDSASFFRFKGQLYDLGEFIKCPNTAWFKGWNGYCNDSYFSGTVIKWVGDDFESVIVGQYFS